MSVKQISAEEFDRMFDNGEDISDYVDWSSTCRPGSENKSADLHLPDWMLRKLDAQALQRGVDRQALVTAWLAERLRAAR